MGRFGPIAGTTAVGTIEALAGVFHGFLVADGPRAQRPHRLQQ